MELRVVAEEARWFDGWCLDRLVRGAARESGDDRDERFAAAVHARNLQNVFGRTQADERRWQAGPP
jgi:hypothetical protein